MTQHGTSVVIKQTNDGLGAEQRRFEMLQVVAKERSTNILHLFSIQVTPERIPACIGLPDKDRKTRVYLQGTSQYVIWMSLDCGNPLAHGENM